MDCILIIDPGKQGALAWMDFDGRPLDWSLMPLCTDELIPITYRDAVKANSKLPKSRRTLVTGLSVDSVQLLHLIAKLPPVWAVLEHQHVLGQQGGAFAIGRNFGLIEAVLRTTQLPYRILTPNEWASGFEWRAHAITGKKERRKAMKQETLDWCAENGYPLPRLKGDQEGVADCWRMGRYAVENREKVEARLINPCFDCY